MKLRNVDCPFVMIDDQEITLDEIIASWRGSQQEAEWFRFQATIFRKVLPISPLPVEAHNSRCVVCVLSGWGECSWSAVPSWTR